MSSLLKAYRCFLNTGSLYQSWKICDQSLDRPVEGLDFGPLVYWIIETSGLYEKKRLCFVDFEQRDAFEPLNERMDRAIL